MYDESAEELTATRPASWLEVLEGRSPILLIAPHGGRAGPAARLKVNPKVNDLYTAEITRSLAQSLAAGVLINSAMDRNQLDCNRLGQLAQRAPWLLEMIARRVEQIVARHGRAIVLMIHGWNVIEPRVDFGLGARLRDGKLAATGSAHISASDDFVNRTVVEMAERLGRIGIIASFGHRYPAGGLHNLLQAFTPRHLESPQPALRQLAALAAERTIDALQLELSVAVRMPGTIRSRALEAISAAFLDGAGSARPSTTPVSVVRGMRAKPAAPAARGQRFGPPARVGIEFYDAAAGVGAMASFDLGPAAMGARIMMLLSGRRVALFTGEGSVRRQGGQIALGPLVLQDHAGQVVLNFSGPAVVVPDGTAYLSIERALASGVLDEAVEVSARLDLEGTPLNLTEALAGEVSAAKPGDWAAAFGRLKGTIVIDGATRTLDAVGRVGLSFAGLGPAHFVSRRMVWACFPSSPTHAALEARSISDDDGTEHRLGRVRGEQGWRECQVERFQLETPSLKAPPEKISLTLATDGAICAPLLGEVRSFVPLSRPGPNQTRIYTTLGFASFSLGPHQGAGMFEYSRRAKPAALAQALEPADSD